MQLLAIRRRSSSASARASVFDNAKERVSVRLSASHHLGFKWHAGRDSHPWLSGSNPGARESDNVYLGLSCLASACTRRETGGWSPALALNGSRLRGPEAEPQALRRVPSPLTRTGASASDTQGFARSKGAPNGFRVTCESRCNEKSPPVPCGGQLHNPRGADVISVIAIGRHRSRPARRLGQLLI